jgi:hypothetical protein
VTESHSVLLESSVIYPHRNELVDEDFGDAFLIMFDETGVTAYVFDELQPSAMALK